VGQNVGPTRTPREQTQRKEKGADVGTLFRIVADPARPRFARTWRPGR
jgi:hypothetical protein